MAGVGGGGGEEQALLLPYSERQLRLLYPNLEKKGAGGGFFK